MKAIKIELPYNLVGAFASFLCLLHCIATPFLFAVQAEVFSHEDSRLGWWGLLDLFFLVISFIAVWRTGKTTSKQWLQSALWISWSFLAFIIFNEKYIALPIAEEAIYIPSLGLIFFHLYNRKYCQCKNNTCCTHVKGE